jgi:3-phenylpropionate/trans-cinnamate dioxygenase ferredoxin reductase component
LDIAGIAGPIVVVGGGLAGGKAAVTLREEGYAGRLVIISAEPGVPFGRPPLSKTYLRGEEDLSAWLVKPESWYEDHGVERVTDTATGFDPRARSVTLRSGEPIPYERLLLATGGANRHLDLPGADLDGVHQLRTVAECDALKRAAVAGSHAVMVGMSFIGCEVAASLRQLGVRVTALPGGRQPLEAALGREVGEVFAAIHRDAGVEILAGEQAAALEGRGRVEQVVTGTGRRIDCDLVVAAVGIAPSTELAARAGAGTDNGVLVDGRCETTIPDVFAAGDVANHLHPLFGRVRVEHYNNAERQGAAAARAMLGSPDPYAPVHSFWSDQYEHKLEYVGYARSWDRFEVRGDLGQRRFLGFYIGGRRLLAAVGLNRGGDPELEPDSELAALARIIEGGEAAFEASHELRDFN